jgi:hypothetical protein
MTLEPSKALSANPKDLFGSKKVSLSKLPAVAVAHAAHAMMDGAQKYGAYNWRTKAVIASIYVDACKRHVDNWFEGQQRATDSEVHHLGHAIACLAILLDAEATGNLIDDRPEGNEVADKVFAEIAAIIERRNAAKAAAAPCKIDPACNGDCAGLLCDEAASLAALPAAQDASNGAA